MSWAPGKCAKAAAVLLAVLGLVNVSVHARTPADSGTKAETKARSSVATTVALSSLPIQARKTHDLILKGGPFPYDKDGTVFFNRERLLPLKSRGHYRYREYTVRTPGVRTRGARRIVCGGEPPTQPEVCFYTADHYSSFNRIVP